MKKLGLEAMSLLTHASYEINMQRRLLLKPDIGREHSSLCCSQLPFTDLLFGDDLTKHLKDIGDQYLQLITVLARSQGSLVTPVTSSQKLERPQSTTLETQRSGEPGQQNPSLKTVEHLPPATSIR